MITALKNALTMLISLRRYYCTCNQPFLQVVLLVVIIFILYMFYMSFMYPADSSSSDYKDKFPDFGQAEDEKLEEK